MGLFDSFTKNKPKPGENPPSTAFAKDLLRGGGLGSHHGVPSDISCVTYEAHSGALAMGTTRGFIKIFFAKGIEILLHDAAQSLRGMASETGLQVPVQHLEWLLGGSHIMAVLRNCAVQVWDVGARELVGCLDSTWTMAGITCLASHPAEQCTPSSQKDPRRQRMRSKPRRKKGEKGDGAVQPALSAPCPHPAYCYLGGDNGTVYVVKCLPSTRACVGYVVARGEATGTSLERKKETNSAAAAASISPLDANNGEDDGVEDEVVALGICPSHPGHLLIGYQVAGLVLWDIEHQVPLKRFQRTLTSLSSSLCGDSVRGSGGGSSSSVAGRLFGGSVSGRSSESHSTSRRHSTSSSPGTFNDDSAMTMADLEADDSACNDNGDGDGSGHLTPEAAKLTCAAWHPDGSHFAAGYDDGSFEVWTVKPAALEGRLGGALGVVPPAPQRVNDQGLNLPPQVLNGMDIKDLDLGDGDPRPVTKLKFVRSTQSGSQSQSSKGAGAGATGGACALVVLGGVNKPVVSSGGRMGASIKYACAHVLYPEPLAFALCARAAHNASLNAGQGCAGGGSGDGDGGGVSSSGVVASDGSDFDGGLRQSTSADGAGGGGGETSGAKGRERRKSIIWTALSGSSSSSSSSGGSGGRSTGGFGSRSDGGVGGAYKCVASLSSEDGEAQDIAAAVLYASCAAESEGGGDASVSSASSSPAATEEASGDAPVAATPPLCVALVGARGKLDTYHFSPVSSTTSPTVVADNPGSGSHRSSPRQPLTSVAAALPGPLVAGGLAGDAVVSFAGQACVHPAVWSRLVATGWNSDHASSSPSSSSSSSPPHLMAEAAAAVAAAQGVGSTSRVEVAPELLRHGRWEATTFDDSDSVTPSPPFQTPSPGGSSPLSSPLSFTPTSPGGGGVWQWPQTPAAASAAASASFPLDRSASMVVHAPSFDLAASAAVTVPWSIGGSDFSCVAVAHADGHVSVLGLSRDRHAEDEPKDKDGNLELGGGLTQALMRSGAQALLADDDDDSEEEEDGDEGEDDKGGGADESSGSGGGLGKLKTAFPRLTTPAALALSRFDVGGFLPAEEEGGAANGPVSLTAVALLMERGLVCVAVGGDHPCAGQVLLLQLTGGTGAKYHGGGAGGVSNAGKKPRIGLAVVEPAEKAVRSSTEAASTAAAAAAAATTPETVKTAKAAPRSSAGSPPSAALAAEAAGGGVGDDSSDSEDSLDGLNEEIAAARRESVCHMAATAAAAAAAAAAATDALVSSPASASDLEAAAATAAVAAPTAAAAVPTGKKPRAIVPAAVVIPSSAGAGGGEDGEGKELPWAWRRVFTVGPNAHMMAVRCVCAAPTGASAVLSDDDTMMDAGHVVVACADGLGCLSLTDTASGVTRTIASGATRGGVVRVVSSSSSGSSSSSSSSRRRLSASPPPHDPQPLRDQRIVKLAFGPVPAGRGAMWGGAATGGPEVLCCSLACGEVHVFHVGSCRQVAVLPSPVLTSGNHSNSADPLAAMFGGGGGVNLSTSGSQNTACCLTHVFSVPSPGQNSGGKGGAGSGHHHHHHHGVPAPHKLVACVAGGNGIALYNIDPHAVAKSGQPPSVEKAVASLQLGAHPVMSASVVEGVGGDGGGEDLKRRGQGVFVVAVTSDWVVWLVAVDNVTSNPKGQAGGSSSSSSSGAHAPKLRVLGMKQAACPGGVPPWDTAPVDASQQSSSSASLAAAAAYDKQVKAEGGTFQVDDAEAEAGGPGRRSLVTAWGELLLTAHGSSECLRLPLLDWATLSTPPLQQNSNTASSSAASSSSLAAVDGSGGNVNVGPTLTAVLSDFPVLTPAPVTQQDEVEAALAAVLAANGGGGFGVSGEEEEEDGKGGGSGEGGNVDDEEYQSPRMQAMSSLNEVNEHEDDDEAAATAAASAAVAALGIDESSSPPASSSSSSKKKVRRATIGVTIMNRFSLSSSSTKEKERGPPIGEKKSIEDGDKGAASSSPPSSLRANARASSSPPAVVVVPKALDLEPIFDVYFALPPKDGLGSGGGGAGGEEDEGDLSNLSAAEKTKRLMLQRSEDLKRVDEKMKRMQQNAEDYRLGAAALKEETKKKANNWPF